MSLTNVWRRMPDGEWEPTNAETVDKDYAKTVSYQSHQFRCNSCRQYVTFVKGKLQRSSFRHSSAYDDKKCEERSVALHRDGSSTESLYLFLPMRLCLRGQEISFEIGFPPIGEEAFEKAVKQRLRVQIVSENYGEQIYIVDRARFSPHSTTWFLLPADWAGTCSVCFEPIHACPNGWRQGIKALSAEGALFDAETGRRVEEYGDVSVGRVYYWLTNRPDFQYCDDIILERIRALRNGYRLYRVTAVKMSVGASDFFFDFLGMRLTGIPAAVDMLWPPMLEADGIFQTNMRRLWVRLQGDADIQAYPQSGNFVKSRIKNVIELDNGDHIQLVCAERYGFRIICLYIIPLDGYSEATFTSLYVMDIDGNELEDRNRGAPKDGVIRVKTEVDAIAEVSDHTGFCYKMLLKPSASEEPHENRICDIQNGYKITIRQGLDIVRQLEFGIKPKTNQAETKPKTWRGQEVSFPKRYASAVQRLDPDSELYKRCVFALKNGSIPLDGYLYLCRIMEGTRDE